MENYFNITRFIALLKRDVFENARSVLLALFTILGIYTVILVLSAIVFNNTTLAMFPDKAYYILFFIAGIFISGMAFSDFRNKEKTMYYLMLPASSLEKFLSMFLLTTVGFVIIYTTLFAGFNLLNILAIKSILGDVSIPFLGFVFADFIDMFLVYLSVQSLFLFGATMFKKSPLFYTFLFSFVAAILYSFIQVMMAKYLFSDLVDVVGSSSGAHIVSTSSDFSFGQMYNGDTSAISLQVSHIFFSYIFPLALWVAVWFKIKEKEV